MLHKKPRCNTCTIMCLSNTEIRCNSSQKFYNCQNNHVFACASTPIAYAITSIVQLHQLFFQRAKRKKKLHFSLCCNKNAICITRKKKKKISVIWDMKLDYLGVLRFSVLE